MDTSRPKFTLVAIAIYLLAVVVCIFLAFDFDGSTNLNWTLVLIGLTLPWSLISIFFAWSLLHGAALEFFTVIYLAFAGLNSLIFYWLYSLRRPKPTKADNGKQTRN
jgi:hypothetical protein